MGGVHQSEFLRSVNNVNIDNLRVMLTADQVVLHVTEECL